MKSVIVFVKHENYEEDSVNNFTECFNTGYSEAYVTPADAVAALQKVYTSFNRNATIGKFTITNVVIG